ncbi:MAG TPA: isoprenylcysteine carboxylmethyltransferase family protein [Sphingomicrobium sp.]|nr:isoprenylcysteine carboxylmethyltransferase family protein [Sphingomicrobium sp.]
MSRVSALLFAIVSYAIFFATFLYLIAFVGDFSLVPITVNKGPEIAPVGAAVIDLVLIALFGFQHSLMARQEFKRQWTRIVPVQIERSVYVLAASAMLMVMFLFWHPIDQAVWSMTGIGVELIWILFWIGWATVLLSTFLLNHFELFGLQQTWFYLRGREAELPKLREPLFYKYVRHPLYLGFLLAFWATPRMTLGHLVLAAGISIYILIAIRLEEHDLISLFGKDYELYREKVGMLMPRFRRRSS